jgi:uncharacterized protein (DUF433 family)
MQEKTMEAVLENLTTNEAAIAAGVSVADINRAIDRKILPKTLYSVTDNRTVRKEACLWIAFYFETAEFLTSAARQRAIADGVDRCQSWSEMRTCKVEESRTVQVVFNGIWEDVDRRLRELQAAQEMVVQDPEILSGMPVIRGTRIPVLDVADLVEGGTSIEELSELYPRLKKEQFRLSSIYAKANPRRGRPKRRTFPERVKVSVSKRRLRDASIGG